MDRILITFVTIVLFAVSGIKAVYLIPMDQSQTDHLRAYGVIYRTLKQGYKCYWLLNYKGGAFAAEDNAFTPDDAAKYGVKGEKISDAGFAKIMNVIENSNMEKVTLEKAPDIAVYTPPDKLPWDDAVTMVLEYTDIPYDKVYDKEISGGGLNDYDWLHLHHEDFTGQYSKFYRAFRNKPWYKRQKMEQENLAAELGFESVPESKKAIALSILNYVEDGGFLFAMCSATNTIDITLAALGTDITETPFDGDPVDPNYQSKLDYSNTFAFEDFSIKTSATAARFGNIDANMVNTPMRVPAADFELFPFSAKLDPVPCMLTQNHTRVIDGFFGLCTSYREEVIKESVIKLAKVPGTHRVKYIHGVKGKGQFAFYGGHDPEDYSHAVGDDPTMLEKHPHSPGYRLILNNVLFPAAEKKEKKT